MQQRSAHKSPVTVQRFHVLSAAFHFQSLLSSSMTRQVRIQSEKQKAVAIVVSLVYTTHLNHNIWYLLFPDPNHYWLYL